MFATITIVVVTLLAAVLAFAATKPNSFRVERATRIEASAQTIFPLIDNFRSWALRSPYEKLDPMMKRTYRARATGPGTVYEWKGTNKAGLRRREITRSTPQTTFP